MPNERKKKEHVVQEKTKTGKKRVYFTYSPDAMRNAVRDVLNAERTVVDAAHWYKVLERTLRDQYK